MSQAFHIPTTAGTYPVGVGPGGVLRRVVINTPESGSAATLYDGSVSQANVIGVITTTTQNRLEYGVTLVNGLTVVTTGGTGPDLTVVFDSGFTQGLQATSP